MGAKITLLGIMAAKNSCHHQGSVIQYISNYENK